MYAFKITKKDCSISVSSENSQLIKREFAKIMFDFLPEPTFDPETVFQSENIDKEIRILQKMGAKVVTSHHDFYETPSEDVLFMLLEQMKHSHADIVKLAVMPNNTDDVLRLLEETSHFHKRYPNQPLITMSMGKMGCISRISGEVFGSCVTFGAGKTASAPGQIPYVDLREILAYMGE